MHIFYAELLQKNLEIKQYSTSLIDTIVRHDSVRNISGKSCHIFLRK